MALHGTNGFVVNGQAGDNSGSSVASAGDVNGDGIADLVIGAPGFYGSNSLLPARPMWSLAEQG